MGPAGPKVKEPLALLAVNQADPAGQHAAAQSTTSLREHLPVQPEPPLGGGLVEQISDEEPTVRQVSGSALDSQLMEGITYTEVSLDSRPTEGSSCQKPVEQSILLSSWTVSPRNCVREQKSEWEPVIIPADSYTPDSRPMEGMTYLEHHTDDSWLVRGASYPRPHVNWEVVNSKPSVNNVMIVKMVNTDASDDVSTQLPENAPAMIDPNMSRKNSPEYVTPVSTPMTALAWPCVDSPRLPKVKHEIVDRMMDSRAVNSTQLESSPPTTDSDLSNENWEDGDCRLLEYAGQVSHDLLKMDSSDEPQFGSDRRQSILELEDAIRREIIKSRLGDTDVSLDEVRSEGLQRWNMDIMVEICMIQRIRRSTII